MNAIAAPTEGELRVKAAQALADRGAKAIVETVRSQGVNVPCGKGCFHCCKEPVEAERTEVQIIIDALTPEQRLAVRNRSIAWLTRAVATNALHPKTPNAFAYRAENLWCPLLEKDGTCMAYDNRPISCRLHIARHSSVGCENDAERVNQKFALSPELTQAVGVAILGDGSVPVVLESDHLGAHLARLLLGAHVHSGSRTIIEITGE